MKQRLGRPKISKTRTNIKMVVCIDVMTPLECKEALGIANGGITDGQMTASSEWDVNNGNHGPRRGRLHYQETASTVGGWVSAFNDDKQWLQIDLGNKNTKVTRVATQGRNGYSQWVATFKLQYSNDGVNFQYYTEQGQTADKVK